MQTKTKTIIFTIFLLLTAVAFLTLSLTKSEAILGNKTKQSNIESINKMNVSSAQKKALRNIIVRGGWPIYRGTFDPTVEMDGESDIANAQIKNQPNWYFNNGTTGTSAFQKWLRVESTLLRTRANTKTSGAAGRPVWGRNISAWTTLDDRQLSGKQRQGQALEFFSRKASYLWSKYGKQAVYMNPDHDDKWHEKNWREAYILSESGGRFIGNALASIASSAQDPTDAIKLLNIYWEKRSAR